MKLGPDRREDERDLRTLEMRDRGVTFADISARYPHRTRNGWIGLHRRIWQEYDRSCQ